MTASMAFWKQKASHTAGARVPTPSSPSAPAATPPPAPKPNAGTPRRRGDGEFVLVRAHLTEKSSVLAERGQYTFVVASGAEKVAIARAVAARYGVHPVRVAIVRLPGKRVRYGKTAGRRSGVKKAIVTLKSGETIPFGVKS